MSTIDLSVTPYIEGNFPSYADALNAANQIMPDGYAATNILERVANSIQKVRRGEAAFERDGVAFPNENYHFPILAALLYVATRERRLTVLDFGGSLGSTYFQNRKLLDGLPVNWNVVEQPHYVDYGKANIPEVNFYYKISDLSHKNINLAIASGSLIYVDDPFKYLTDLLGVHAKFFIVDRTYFNFEPKNRIVLQHVPESIYKAVFPNTLLNLAEFESLVTKFYRPVFYMPAFDTTPFIENNTAQITPCHGWLFEHI